MCNKLILINGHYYSILWSTQNFAVSFSRFHNKSAKIIFRIATVLFQADYIRSSISLSITRQSSPLTQPHKSQLGKGHLNSQNFIKKKLLPTFLCYYFVKFHEYEMQRQPFFKNLFHPFQNADNFHIKDFQNIQVNCWAAIPLNLPSQLTSCLFQHDKFILNDIPPYYILTLAWHVPELKCRPTGAI